MEVETAMNILGMAVIGVMLWSGALPKEIGAAGRQVEVCMTHTEEIMLLKQARGIASGMLAGAGVKVQWHEPGKCPPEAIFITLSDAESARQMPGALAYALPFQGTRVVVFYDRVKHRPAPARSVLAHVIVHEITHILQGVILHSKSGIMKADWNERDYQEMIRGPLQFTEEDIARIQHGVTGWAVRRTRGGGQTRRAR